MEKDHSPVNLPLLIIHEHGFSLHRTHENKTAFPIKSGSAHCHMSHVEIKRQMENVFNGIQISLLRDDGNLFRERDFGEENMKHNAEVLWL